MRCPGPGDLKVLLHYPRTTSPMSAVSSRYLARPRGGTAWPRTSTRADNTTAHRSSDPRCSWHSLVSCKNHPFGSFSFPIRKHQAAAGYEGQRLVGQRCRRRSRWRLLNNHQHGLHWHVAERPRRDVVSACVAFCEGWTRYARICVHRMHAERCRARRGARCVACTSPCVLRTSGMHLRTCSWSTWSDVE